MEQIVRTDSIRFDDGEVQCSDIFRYSSCNQSNSESADILYSENEKALLLFFVKP